MQGNPVHTVRFMRIPKLTSCHVGKIGQTINWTLTLFSRYIVIKGCFRREYFSCIENGLGDDDYKTILVFLDPNGNRIVWKAKGIQLTEKDLRKTYVVTGKIKDHIEYEGNKQTILTNCVLTEVN